MSARGASGARDACLVSRFLSLYISDAFQINKCHDSRVYGPATPVRLETTTARRRRRRARARTRDSKNRARGGRPPPRAARPRAARSRHARAFEARACARGWRAARLARKAPQPDARVEHNRRRRRRRRPRARWRLPKSSPRRLIPARALRRAPRRRHRRGRRHGVNGGLDTCTRDN